MDGPRAVRADEMDALRKLTDAVFRPGMPEQYPQLFNSENLENLRVCFDGSICVSHVGMTQRDALLMGCRIRVCCIGSVATHPEYRNQGLASACFDSAVEKAHADGVDVMIVSGGRGLYTRNGCLRLGRDYKVKISTEDLREYSLDTSVVTGTMANDDLELIAECYRKEPVRFVRPPEDYRYLIESGWAMNAPSQILTIRHLPSSGKPHGEFLGYMILRTPDPGTSTSLTEFGGDRHAVLGAIPQVFERYELSELSFQVMGSDSIMEALCQQAGFEMTATSASGTIKLINFPQLMDRMKPRFAEIIGSTMADQLRFEQDDEQYIFALGREVLSLNRDSATRTVFGDLHRPPKEIASAGPPSGLELLRNLSLILPLPTLWYGINYV